MQADNKIVVAGHSVTGSTFDFAVARYNSDGTLDTAFGNGGLVTTDTSGGIPFGHDFAEDLAIQTDGKIVVVGTNTSSTFNDFVVVRYHSDGSVDTSFGDNGMLVIDFHGSGDVGRDVVIQPDGKIVASGYAVNGNDESFVLLRALP